MRLNLKRLFASWKRAGVAGVASVALSAGLALSAGATSDGNLITNAGFESPGGNAQDYVLVSNELGYYRFVENVTTNFGYIAPTGWERRDSFGNPQADGVPLRLWYATDLDLAGGDIGLFPGAGNDFAMILDTAGPPEVLAQSGLSLTMGQEYQLDFDIWSSSPVGDTADIAVQLVGVTNTIVLGDFEDLIAGGVGIAPQSTTFTPTSTEDYRIEFTRSVASVSSGNVHWLDNISLTAVGALAGVAVVPEPTSGLLLVLALVSVVVWNRRKRPALGSRSLTLGAALGIALLVSPAAFAAHPSGSTVPAGFIDAADVTYGGAFNPLDATAKLQAAIDTGSNVFVPYMGAGMDWLVDPIFLTQDSQTIIFEDQVVVEARAGFAAGADLFDGNSRSNVRLEGYGATFRMQRPGGTPEGRFAIVLSAVANFEIVGLTIEDASFDAIYVAAPPTPGQFSASQNVTIRDVTINNAYRNGVSVISVKNLLIEDSVIANTSGSAGGPWAGIDFEPDSPAQRLENVTVRNTVIVGNDGAGIDWIVEDGVSIMPVTGLIENVTIVDNGDLHTLAGLNFRRGALPGVVVRDSLLIDNTNFGFQVIGGDGTTIQSIEHSAFSGNGSTTNGQTLLDTGSFIGTAMAGTVPIFVNTTDPTDPLYYALDPSTSTLISLGASDGSFMGARGVAGDFDADAGIDGFDFLTWQRGFGDTHDADDLAAWETYFGATGSPLSGLAAGVGAVPEPSTVTLVGLMLAGFVIGRRRRK